MIHLSIKSDVQRAVADLNLAAQKRVPFATARTLTALAFEVQVSERAAMAETFTNPRPFTRRGTLVNKATKGHPIATVYLRDEVAAYLAPFELGGPRRVPGKGIAVMQPVGLRLDKYGQVRGQPSAIGDKPNVFAGQVQTKRGLVWGFWQRVKSKDSGPRLKLLVRAAAAAPVKQHLGFVERARAVAAARGAAVFSQELARVVASGR